jgi:hypothetical protein
MAPLLDMDSGNNDDTACNDDIDEHLAIIAYLQKMLDDAEKEKKKRSCYGG